MRFLKTPDTIYTCALFASDIFTPSRLCIITLFHCSVIKHSFQQQKKEEKKEIVSDFATFHQLCTF